MLLAVLLGAALRSPIVLADPLPDLRAQYDQAIRQLDGEEYFEDQPLWLCIEPAKGQSPGIPEAYGYRLVGFDAQGHPVRREFRDQRGAISGRLRSFEFGQIFGFQDAEGRYPLLGMTGMPAFRGAGGIPEGQWQVRLLADSTRKLAQFRIVAPSGSERSVRDGLARAARLAAGLHPGDQARAAALYEAIYQRYPRSSYLSVIYCGEWKVREHTRFAKDPERWLEEIFAHFHDSCFGVIALDRWVADMGEEAARPTIRRLVGIYPDTPLSRAAQRYL